MILPEKVTIIEVGPRDGLQNEKEFVPTEKKRKFIGALKNAGFREMELTSFVSPKWVPQMSDADEIAALCSGEETRDFVLVPNRRGAERLLNFNSVEAAAVFIGTSDSFNKKNVNKSVRESLDELKTVTELLKNQGFFIRACVSTAFYCPFEGRIPEKKTMDLCQKLIDFGADELSVADTIGMASPNEVYSLFSKIKDRFSDTLITAHFHDTRKMGLANVLAALQAGVDRFDTSAGGLGGCPFAPGASGNAATEDVVYMLERMGIRTGISLEQVVEALDVIRPYIKRPLESGYLKIRQPI